MKYRRIHSNQNPAVIRHSNLIQAHLNLSPRSRCTDSDAAETAWRLQDLARIFHKGRHEKSESAGDSTVDAGNCLQAYWQYVENNFQDKR